MQELKEIQLTLQKQNYDLEKSLINNEKFTCEIKQSLDGERLKYHKELIKFQDKLGSVKNLQITIQGEKSKSENLTLKLQES